MFKIMTIVGTRPELIKMSRVINEFDKYANHILVHTGQNYDYELNQIFFDELQIRKPDYFLNSNRGSPAQTVAKIIDASDKLIAKLKPDAILFYGDTNSCLAVISAKKRQIPIFHMEAGNRSFDQRVPEEINRKILDHLSDINLVLTEQARENLLAEGIPSHLIFKTGSHMNEVIDFYKSKILKSKILSKLKIKKAMYFVVSLHREENVDYEVNLMSILASLNAVADKYNLPILVSTHPRTRLRLEKLNFKFHNKINFLKPFGFFDYIFLQMNAICVISDSGTITEESSLLNFPAITIRNSHERPEGMDSGVLIMSGLNPINVLNAIHTVISQSKEYILNPVVSDYKSDLVSLKIIRIVFSYIEYINQIILKKIE